MLNSSLTKGAKELIETMKTPVTFLKFIGECLSWVHEHEVSKTVRSENDDPHFILTSFLEHVIPAWMGGGNNVVQNVADGLKKICDFNGYGGYMRDISGILASYSFLTKDGRPSVDYENQCLEGINMLFKIGSSFANYEMAQSYSEIKN